MYSNSLSSTVSAIPGIPQRVTADRKTAPSNIHCVVLVQWDPPNNAAETLVKYYIVDFQSGTFVTTMTSVLVQCGADSYIRIHAVDECDREGPSTDDTLAELLELVDSTSVPATESKTIVYEFHNDSKNSELLCFVMI